MPRYTYSTGVRVKVAEYDTSLMLTLKDIINGCELSKSFLIRKDDAPAGKLRDLYNTKDNAGLIRKIFVYCLKRILQDVANGKSNFYLPTNAKFKPIIYVGYLNDIVVKSK
jgi:hypothetical protein